MKLKATYRNTIYEKYDLKIITFSRRNQTWNAYKFRDENVKVIHKILLKIPPNNGKITQKQNMNTYAESVAAVTFGNAASKIKL